MTEVPGTPQDICTALYDAFIGALVGALVEGLVEVLRGPVGKELADAAQRLADIIGDQYEPGADCD